MEDIYDVNDSSDNTTVEITPNSAMLKVMVRDYSDKRQEPYTSRERKLLMNLIAEYDTEGLLFSAKRDMDTCQQKHELWELIESRFNSSSGRPVPSNKRQLCKLTRQITYEAKKKGKPRPVPSPSRPVAFQPRLTKRERPDEDEETEQVEAEQEDLYVGTDDPLSQAVRIVSTTSSKYTKIGQIRFRWKLDVPVVVLKHHGTTNFRSESPEFDVECETNSHNINMNFSVIFYLNYKGSDKFEVKLRNMNDEMIDLSVVNLTMTHVDLSGREVAKPFGGSQKIKSLSSFTLDCYEEVSIFSANSNSFPLLSKMFSYLQWTNLTEVSLLFELNLELYKILHV